MKALFHKFPTNIARCFRGYNLIWHLLAIAITYIIVNSGFDWFYFSHSRSTFLRSIIFPAVIIGGLLPIIAPIVLLIAGKIIKNSRIIISAFALAQAAILGSLISFFYKIFTGRVPPPEIFSHSIAITDISHQFQFVGGCRVQVDAESFSG